MDGLAIAAALTEIHRVASNASIRMIYQPDQWTFIVHLFAGKEWRLLISPRAARIHLTQLDLPYPQMPSPFTMLLRKHLRGGRITAITQDGWERVVRIVVIRRTADGMSNLELIAELIGVRGNLVLVRDDRVIAAMRADPRIKPGEVYQPLPPQDKLDPREVSAQVLSEVLATDDPTRTLVNRIDGIGKDTARAIMSYKSDPQVVSAHIAEIVSHVSAPIGCYDPGSGTAYFFPVGDCETYASFSAALDQEYAAAHESGDFDRERRSLRLRLERALARRRRTLDKLVRWLEEAKREDTLRYYADLIMIHLNDLSRGMTQATLIDPQTETTVQIPLNPRLGPIENAQALYERAKRLHRGRPRVEARKRRLEQEISLLENGLNAIATGAPPPEAAVSLIPTPTTRGKSQLRPTAPRTYRIDGYTIEVGKNAAQNDALLRQARPNDLWLHAVDLPGAHVIIHRRDKEEIPHAVIEQAARLAARFSKGAKEPRVAVHVTPVKYVRKPKGAPPGLVILTRADTLMVNQEHTGDKE